MDLREVAGRWLGNDDFLALVEDCCEPLIVLPWQRWLELPHRPV